MAKFKIEDLSQYSGRSPHIVVYRKYKGTFYHVADCDSQDQAERLIRHVEKKKFSPYHEDYACVEFFKFAQKFFEKERSMSVAEQIADRFDNDGQNFLDGNDNDITEVLDRAALGVDTHRDSTIYTLRDYSMIVVNDSYWDILTQRNGPEGPGLYDSSGALYNRH